MKIFLLVGVLLSSTLVFAQKNYIKGIQKVTFRAGPEKTKKIIRMLPTESAVTVVEAGAQWTKVKDSTGEEGYVLNRFLSKDIPYSLRYQWLKKKFDKMKERNIELNTKLKELGASLKDTETALKSSEENLKQTSTSFDELKTGSADFLNLKKKYDETAERLESQTNRVGELQSKVSTYYIFWFLAGSGVLFLGWIIGLFSRKRKKSGSLSF